MLVIASWNINSIKARLSHVLDWIDSTQPDILCLQELKCESGAFPEAPFIERGYHLTVRGQKAYNGVAICSREPVAVINDRLLDHDDQARFLDIETANGLRVINIYAPNGNPVDSPKFPYKGEWLDALTAYAAGLLEKDVPFLIAGDFNIIPEPRDAATPSAWANDALFRPESRARWRALCNLGLYDACRIVHPHDRGLYTFWDYQGAAWAQDNGIRIDHCLLSPELADDLDSFAIDRTPRGWDKASDHTPVLVALRCGGD